MKSKLPTIALLLSLSFLLTACSLQDISLPELPLESLKELPVIGEYLPFGNGSTPKTDGPITLTMWGLWEDPEMMDSFIAEYQQQHPHVTIEYEDRSVLKPLSLYKERVFNRVAEEGGPDIVRLHNSWVSRLSPRLTPMPKSKMSVEEYNNIFYPVASESAVVNGEIYAMPFYYDGLALVYNRDHFAEIGQQAPPTAWEEFRRLARELSLYSDDKLIRAGAAMGTADNIEHFSDILGLLWAQADVSMPMEIDSVNAQDALSFYTNFAKEDKVWDSTFPEAVTAFANGEVSMIFVPSWRILDILAVSPGLNIGVAQVPQVTSEEPGAWATFWMEAVSAESKNPNIAWDFLAFMAQKQQQLAYYNNAAEERFFGSPYARVDLAEELALNDYLRPYVLDAPYAHSAEITARSGNERQVGALQTAVNAVLEGQSPESALTQAKAIITQ